MLSFDWMITNCRWYQIPLPKDSQAPLCQKCMVELPCNVVESFSMARIPSDIMARNTLGNREGGLFETKDKFFYVQGKCKILP